MGNQFIAPGRLRSSSILSPLARFETIDTLDGVATALTTGHLARAPQLAAATRLTGLRSLPDNAFHFSAFGVR